MEQLYKDTFINISKERRDRVLDAAKKEFASKGYRASNINTIAKEAGISIGSLYSYFASKEDLFLCILEQGCEYLYEALNDISKEQNIIDILRDLFRKASHYAKTYPEINQMYLDVTTQGMSHLSSRLSNKIESGTMKFYLEIIDNAKKRGQIPGYIENRLLALTFDNLILMFQFAYTSEYHKKRMEIFLGREFANQEERNIEGIVSIIRSWITPSDRMDSFKKGLS